MRLASALRDAASPSRRPIGRPAATTPRCAKLTYVTSVDAWSAELASLLAEAGGPDVADRFAHRVPTWYREVTSPVEALGDVEEIRLLVAAGRQGQPGGSGAQARFGGQHRLVVRTGGNGPAFRLRRFGLGPVVLSAFLPVLESFGLVVEEAVPFRLAGSGGEPEVFVDDFGLRLGLEPDETADFDPLVDGSRLVAGLEAVAAGRCDVDSLNRLVLAAGLDWTRVMVLRAYRRYRIQAGPALASGPVEDALVAYPAVARSLIAYFEARFDPACRATDASAAAAQVAVQTALEAVSAFPEDQALRHYLGLIDATTRTTFFRPDGLGGIDATSGIGTVTLKLDGARIPDLARPRAALETWVHGPSVEGIHLRAGLVARGGIRWSSRPEDFRTEILSLAMAQVKKNAIIVPTGAKGGFVCRGDADNHTEALPGPQDVKSTYERFVGSLLDVTDNVVAGTVVSPPGVLATDGPDPYLVVAADRGTAALSDTANRLAVGRRFWLGDAFASGGSHGYDHKAMGITARGAWVAVRRHFHQLGIDVASEPIRVVGVGDMSGDVFGNGMLHSEALRLVAAFDGQHVFIDPDPDPAASFAERQRLARLPGSSWADYDPSVISTGGGVWDRSAKRIVVAVPARRALGITDAELSPPEVISAILAAPVDLLWFGGVGTFVKAPREPDADVGDHANDDVRITSDRVRARVVAEGGNLAVTQRARIAYSRRGGRINTDFIDNAAGVATSDREVNLKVLLGLAVDAGRLDEQGRDRLLSDATDAVAAAVLSQVDRAVSALDRAVPASAAQLGAYQALLEDLVAAGVLDRSVEGLPDLEEMATRSQAGAGMIRPELAVLLAYAKSALAADIEADGALVRDATIIEMVADYFPAAIRERFGDLVGAHRLYPQLAATSVAGDIVDQMGVIWAHESAAELGRTVPEVVAAFWAARQVLDAGALWADLEAASPGLAADAEARLHQLVVEAVDTLARAYLRRPGMVDPARLISHDRPVAQAIAAAGPPELPDRDQRADLLDLGITPSMAARYAGTARLARCSDASELARDLGRPITDVTETLAKIDGDSGADRLRQAIERIPIHGRWQAWQARALLDDLESWRHRVARDALQGHRGQTPAEATSAWVQPRRADLRHTHRLLDQLQPADRDALLLAALVLRSLRKAATTADLPAEDHLRAASEG